MLLSRLLPCVLLCLLLLTMLGQLEGKYIRYFGGDGIAFTFQDSAFEYAFHHDLSHNAYGLGTYVLKNDTLCFFFTKHPDDIEPHMSDFGNDTITYFIASLRKSMIHYFPEGTVWKCLVEELDEEGFVLRRTEGGEFSKWLGIYRKYR